MQKNLNSEKIIFKDVQIKFLAMHITNQKIRFDMFTVQISSWNMILISNDFWHKIKIYHFDYGYKYTRAAYDWVTYLNSPVNIHHIYTSCIVHTHSAFISSVHAMHISLINFIKAHLLVQDDTRSESDCGLLKLAAGLQIQSLQSYRRSDAACSAVSQSRSGGKQRRNIS